MNARMAWGDCRSAAVSGPGALAILIEIYP
jgi:hypothetical protein